MRDASQSLGGYIRLYRSLLEWEWFQDSATLHVFLFLLLSACFRPIRHAGVELAPGQLITSYSTICARTGLTLAQVRTALRHLKSTGEITQRTTPGFSLITLTNFSRWQTALEHTSQQTANTRPTHDQQHNKNDNHVNHEKKKGASPYEYANRNENAGKRGHDHANRYAGVGVCV